MTVTTSMKLGRTMSWDEYTALPEAPLHEYIDGMAVMVPSPDQDHQDISWALVSLLRPVLPATHHATFAWSWKPGPDEFIPDVIVFPLAERTTKKRFTGTPALVVEVLSGNRGDDLLVKMNKYPATGLPYYWIVDPRERTLATFVRDDSGAFRASRVVYEADGTVELDLGVARVSLALTDVLPQD